MYLTPDIKSNRARPPTKKSKFQWTLFHSADLKVFRIVWRRGLIPLTKQCNTPKKSSKTELFSVTSH